MNQTPPPFRLIPPFEVDIDSLAGKKRVKDEHVMNQEQFDATLEKQSKLARLVMYYYSQ